MPYTSFIGMMQTVRITGRPAPSTGDYYPEVLLPSEINPNLSYMDQYMTADGTVLDFAEDAKNPWYNGQAGSSNSPVKDPSVASTGRGVGGWKEGGEGAMTPDQNTASMYDTPEIPDGTMLNHTPALNGIKLEFEVDVYVGDGPKAGTVVGHLKYEITRDLQGKISGPVVTEENMGPPSPAFDAARDEAITHHFALAPLDFVWPLPQTPIRWGSEIVPCD